MKKIKKTPLSATIGAAVISTFAASYANAEVNPFGMSELSNGYMQVAEADKAGEMACGAAMGGMEKPKAPEGACAGNKTKAKAPAAGEGKCGGMMDGDKMKPGMEMACGAMMKGKEGACGTMKPGESMKGKEGACGGAACPKEEGAAPAAPKKTENTNMEGGCGSNMPKK